MKHARQDYNRFQEPDELLHMINRLTSYIRSGEDLNEQDERDLEILREKYGRVADQIPDNEPVFLIRGQDQFAGQMIEHYTSLCREQRIDLEEEARFARTHNQQDDLNECETGAAKLLEMEMILVPHAILVRAWPTKKSSDLPQIIDNRA